MCICIALPILYTGRNEFAFDFSHTLFTILQSNQLVGGKDNTQCWQRYEQEKFQTVTMRI
jgi:hypothetical protein